jgi:hypothetical protein|tara:strand:- start:523 stop:828 length:306 start_codon:yes stop_codon:yes gene_type:complete
MESSKNFVIYEGLDYEARLEYNREYLILHLPEVKQFNKTTLMSMLIRLDDLNDFRIGLGYLELYCAAPEDNVKINKLAKRVGFEFFAKEGGLNVYTYKGIE